MAELNIEIAQESNMNNNKVIYENNLIKFIYIFSGVWTSTDDLRRLKKIEKIFSPSDMRKREHLSNLEKWLKAVKRFQKWST